MLTNVVFSSGGTNGSYSASINTDQNKKEHDRRKRSKSAYYPD